MHTYLLDFDGTLCDSRPAIQQSMLDLLQDEIRARAPNTDVAALLGSGMTVQDTLRHLGVADGHIPTWVDKYRVHYARNESRAGLFDGVTETLATLKANGHCLILLSNKGHAAIARSIKALQLEGYFDLVLAEQTGLTNKPDSAVFGQRIAPVFPELLPANCTMVGDTPVDLQFAKAIGARACFAAYGYGHLPSCEEVGYDFRLECFADILMI